MHRHALTEHSVLDQCTGRIVDANLADYHGPVIAHGVLDSRVDIRMRARWCSIRTARDGPHVDALHIDRIEEASC